MASVAIIREAFSRTYRAPTRFAIRAWLRLVRDPLKLLARLPLARLCRVMYGATMAFEQELGEGRVDLVVTRCAYHRFFIKAGEPDLTRVFCDWDRNWMDAVDASDRPIRIERPTTFSTGGDCCRFRFVSEESPRVGPPLDVMNGS